MSSRTLALGSMLLLAAGLTANAVESAVEDPAGTDAGVAEAAAAVPAEAVPSDASPAGRETAPAEEAAMPEESLAGGEAAPAADAATPEPDGTAEDTALAPEGVDGASQAADAGSPADAEMAAASEPGDGAEQAAAPQGAVEPAPAPPGAVGYDEQGRQGWIHVVESGDTLWDISDAYLGTPWVWPSIWRQNEDIENPHRIYPGDRIWITPTEMRRVTRAEADQLLAGASGDEPARAALEDSFAAPEPLPERPQQVVRLPNLAALGLVTVEEFEAASSIVDSPSPYIWLSEGETVFLGLGEGEVQVGDEFTVFRKSETVREPDSGKVLGHFVDVLGWIEVVKLHPETAEGVIRESSSEMHRGDTVMPRLKIPERIPLREPRESVKGQIVFAPHFRDLGGTNDFVYLNRGALHGLDVGNTLEVYRNMGRGEDRVRDSEFLLPDDIVGSLLVVSARPETSVALVTQAHYELATGDHFRTPMH